MRKEQKEFETGANADSGTWNCPETERTENMAGRNVGNDQDVELLAKVPSE
jgi:hypothetical protein